MATMTTAPPRMTDPMAPLPALPALRYAQVRRRWFWAMLVRLLRKWAIYIVMGLAIFGAFSVGATTSMAAIAAWTVLILFKATQWPWFTALACALAHGLTGVLIVLALRPVLWSESWLEAERALPIAPRETQASDAALIGLCLLPLFAMYVAGGVTWTVQSPAWLHGATGQAWAWLAVSMATSVAGGLAGITCLRRPARRHMPAAQASDAGPAHGHDAVSAGPLPRLRTAQALIALPVWRGPARGLGFALLVFSLGAMSVLAFVACSGAHVASWGLAGLGLWTLMATARLTTLTAAQLQPMHDAACEVLPISNVALRAARRALVSLPALLAWLTLPMLWAWGPLTVRPLVALIYWLGFAGVHAWHAMQPPHDDQSQVSRWLGALIVLAALASEVYTG